MPENLKIGAFVFGAILVLIALLGGNFKLFGAEVAATVSNPLLRFVAFALGGIFLVVAVHPIDGDMSVVSSPPSAKSTQTSPSPSPSTPTPTPIVTAPGSTNLTGVWDLKLTANKRVGQDGFVNDFNGVAEYVIEFDSVDSIITGKVLGARGSTGNLCSDAVINGNIDGRNVNYTLQYTGSCCSNETMTFKLVLNPQGVLQGRTAPEKIPTSNCQLWYGTVIATKRASDSQ